MLLDIVLWILFGALAGWIASVIMKTDAKMGAFANIVVGIIGAFLGGFLVQNMLGASVEGFNIISLLVAILGAILLIAIVKAFTRNSAHRVQ